MSSSEGNVDTIVVGLGAAGSATAYALARAGVSVVGLEQFQPLHDQGSSHGRTRIYRTAYFEGPAYVPLVRRAQELWKQLEDAARVPIIRPTGGLVIGRPDSPMVRGSRGTAEAFGLKHTVLPAAQAQERFPQFGLRPDEVAVWDPQAGVLFAENCVRAQLDGARSAGAELHFGEAVREWNANELGVTARSDRGTYRARSLVLCAGAWTAPLVGGVKLPLEIERQFVYWFPATDAPLVRADRMPVFIWDRTPQIQTYGIPDLGDGVKVGGWQGRIAPSIDRVDRVFHEEEARPVREFVANALRGVRPTESDRVSCLYTNTPDRDFVLGLHPSHPNVVVVSACSGHGFKFASVTGEIAGRLARGEDPGFDLSPFAPGRFESVVPQ